MRTVLTCPIPFHYFLWAFVKTFFHWLHLAMIHHYRENKYYYSRRLYFRFLPQAMKVRFSNYLPQEKPCTKMNQEWNKWLIINLIKFGKFSSDQITNALIFHGVQGVTNKVVEDIFNDNMAEYKNLSNDYLNRFNR